MSQIPPSQPLPSGYSAPPPGPSVPAGPYGGYPPVGQPGRTNGPAIASLVCGILGCVPLLTSLVAIVLGIVGIRKARDPRVGGKSLAIAGLVLGLVGVAGWGLFGGGLVTAYVLSKPARAVSHQFAADLSAGNIDAAAAATAGISRDQLVNASQGLQAWGPLTDVTLPGFNYRANVGGGTICELTGAATFATAGAKTYTVTLIKQNGTFKIQQFNFR